MYNDQLVYMVVIWVFLGIYLRKEKVALSLMFVYCTHNIADVFLILYINKRYM